MRWKLRRHPPDNPVDPVRARMTEQIIKDVREMVRELNQLTAPILRPEGGEQWKK